MEYTVDKYGNVSLPKIDKDSDYIELLKGIQDIMEDKDIYTISGLDDGFIWYVSNRNGELLYDREGYTMAKYNKYNVNDQWVFGFDKEDYDLIMCELNRVS